MKKRKFQFLISHKYWESEKYLKIFARRSHNALHIVNRFFLNFVQLVKLELLLAICVDKSRPKRVCSSCGCSTARYPTIKLLVSDKRQ